MTSLIPFYQTNDPVGDYQRAISHLPLQELRAEHQHTAMLALEFDGDSRTVLEVQLEAFKREIARQERILAARAHDPIAGVIDTTMVDVSARIAAAKAALPITEFCERVLGVRIEHRTRDRLRGRCPLPGHDDHDPSFTIYVDNNNAWCFGCGRGGDSIELAGLFFGFERFFDRLECVERHAGTSQPAQPRPKVEGVRSQRPPVTAPRLVDGRWLA